ncbi:MAG: hypothetical protein H6Q81_2660 [Deltaproteobacteria bacterium]|jgi:hypothetical protein|nr:hypothetical protein [Deltaproteobacteria bacterium]
MMHPGKPDRVRASIIGLLAMIGIVLLSETVGLAQRTVQKGGGIEGFRELRWGASIEQSMKIYQDLYFEKYVISDSKEEPRRVYVRRVEHGEIEDVVFDSIEYWFKGDHFYQVRALLHSRIGPRTMVTRAENAFAKMNGRLRNRYGEPSGHKVDYVTEFIVVVREATWNVDPSAITIKYEGVGSTNEDLFTLTMQEKPKR